SADNAMRRPTRHVHALEHNHASRRQQQARDNIEQGGFAGPIRSNQRGNRPLSDLETRPVQGCQTTKMFVEVLDDQHHHMHSQKQKWTYVGSASTRSLLYIEHRRRVATHHLLSILPREGPHEFVQGRLRFQPDGPEVREVGAPEDLPDAYVRNGVVSRRIADESMPDPWP